MQKLSLTPRPSCRSTAASSFFAGGDVEPTEVLPSPGQDEVGLLTSSSRSVELTGALINDVVTGSSFAGTVSIAADAAPKVDAVVTEKLGTIGTDQVTHLPVPAPVDGESRLGREILAASATLDTVLTPTENRATFAN
jgi:hypothetical protein